MLDSFTIQIYFVFFFKYNQIPSHAYLPITFLKNYALESEESLRKVCAITHILLNQAASSWKEGL